MFGAHYWSAAKATTTKAAVEADAGLLKTALGRDLALNNSDHENNRIRSKLIHKFSHFDNGHVSSRQEVLALGQQDLVKRRHPSMPQLFSTSERTPSDPISIPFRRVIHEPSRQIGLTRSQPIDIPLHRRSPVISIRPENKLTSVFDDSEEFEHLYPWMVPNERKGKMANIECETNEDELFESKAFPCSFATIPPTYPHSIDFDL